MSAVRADPTALGTIPAKAMRYCEALRTASSFGWYAFPASSATLMFDGFDIYIEIDSEWELLTTEHASNPDQWWNTHCPTYLQDFAPPFVTSIGVPGYVQVWSGLLVQTKKNWSTLVRPIANTTVSGQYFCFEGIVETDNYAPSPLFVNMRLTASNTPVFITADEPLFQIQAIHRSCYAPETLNSYKEDLPENLTEDDWSGYRKTVRAIDTSVDDHDTGQYAVEVRKRSKSKKSP